MKKVSILLPLVASSSSLFVTIHGFTSSPSLYAKAKIHFKHTNALFSTLNDNNTSQSKLGAGIDIFEKWFQSVAVSSSNNENLNLFRHNFFSNGRGLEYIGTKKDLVDSSGSETAIISLPKEFILQSTFRDDKEELEDISTDWDVILAIKLLKECKLGGKSSLYGYCALLTQGDDFNSAIPCPPSTAPDTIRNWSEEEKQILKSTKRGGRLLNVEKKQSQEWKDKYTALSNSDREEYTYEQFRWAMEAVHSRAFKGDFSGQDPLKELSKALIPFAAGAFALNYIRSDPFGANENITLVLLLLCCAPVILNFLSDNVVGSTVDAVMLPLIDSANHKESARSSIAFDPLKGAFTVTIEGTNVIEKDSDLNQFYISYGKKYDTELLLNYGFLNGLKENFESQEERRRLLAETFNSRSLQ